MRNRALRQVLVFARVGHVVLFVERHAVGDQERDAPVEVAHIAAE